MMTELSFLVGVSLSVCATDMNDSSNLLGRKKYYMDGLEPLIKSKMTFLIYELANFSFVMRVCFHVHLCEF